MKRILSFLLISVCLVSCKPKYDWQELFNGKDFSGFKQINSESIFKIENGELVGVSKKGIPNGFLCTEKEYKNFILEFEVKIDSRLNSGVQIRSHTEKNKVLGYQVEIDPSERGWSAGIYDEGRRGWLYPVTTYNPKVKDVFKRGNWNKYRIEAVGNRIRTWLNEVPIADLLDDMDASGFIGFELHSIPDNLDGAEIRWKNIKIAKKHLDEYLTSPEIVIHQVNAIPNTISEFEAGNGWKLLFDGKSVEKWRGVNHDSFPEDYWTVEDETLKAVEFNVLENGLELGEEILVKADDTEEIISIDEFSDFALSIDFKLTEGAEGAIKYFVAETDSTAIGLKYELLDDNILDLTSKNKPIRSLGSLCNLIPANNKNFNGIGYWNTAKIIANKTKVEHWLNGIKILEYDRNSDKFKKLIKGSQYNMFEDLSKKTKGHILLQNKHSGIYYRNIKIRSLI